MNKCLTDSDSSSSSYSVTFELYMDVEAPNGLPAFIITLCSSGDVIIGFCVCVHAYTRVYSLMCWKWCFLHEITAE